MNDPDNPLHGARRVAFAPARQLALRERSLVTFLLRADFQGRDELLRQAESALVSGECPCGCGSIALSVARRDAARATVRHRVPIEAEWVEDDGVTAHALLHVVDGFLAELELYREDAKPLLRWPRTEALRLVDYWEDETPDP